MPHSGRSFLEILVNVNLSDRKQVLENTVFREKARCLRPFLLLSGSVLLLESLPILDYRISVPTLPIP